MNSVDARPSPESGTLKLIMTGRWDSDTTGNWWHRGQQMLAQSKPRRLVIDASGVSYCDGAGIAFLVALQQLPARIGNWSLTNLQQRVVKTGGRLIKHARYYWLLLAESHLMRRLFAGMLRRIAALPLPAG